MMLAVSVALKNWTVRHSLHTEQSTYLVIVDFTSLILAEDLFAFSSNFYRKNIHELSPQLLGLTTCRYLAYSSPNLCPVTAACFWPSSVRYLEKFPSEVNAVACFEAKELDVVKFKIIYNDSGTRYLSESWVPSKLY